jgi:hypothetical protein
MSMDSASTAVERWLFGVCGVWLVGLGVYFIAVRPVLLPEDIRFIGAASTALDSGAPGLHAWLRHVFIVLGGFMLGSGALTLGAIARLDAPRTRLALAITGLSTVGLMSAVNFRIGSDFRWLLLLPALLWLCALCTPLWRRVAFGQRRRRDAPPGSP